MLIFEYFLVNQFSTYCENWKAVGPKYLVITSLRTDLSREVLNVWKFVTNRVCMKWMAVMSMVKMTLYLHSYKALVSYIAFAHYHGQRLGSSSDTIELGANCN